MRNLHLSGRSLDTPAEVVRSLTCIQSQDFGPAKWSIGQRCRGLDDGDLDRAFARGKFLRTHILRPTWHFVLPEDIAWILQLTSPRVHAVSASRHRELGLDGPTVRKSQKLLKRELEGGNHLTRAAVKGMFTKARIADDGSRVGHLMMIAELDGVVCSGPLDGRQHTYALLEERAPKPRALGYEEALAELALRYFTSHGPATANDFKWWSSLKITQVREGLEAAGEGLTSETIDGRTFWFAPGRQPERRKSPIVRLLQAFDEYTVAYSDTKEVFDTTGLARIVGRPVFPGTIVVDGSVAGRWKRTLKKDAVVVETELPRGFGQTERRALQAEVRKLGSFLGLRTELVA